MQIPKAVDLRASLKQHLRYLSLPMADRVHQRRQRRLVSTVRAGTAREQRSHCAHVAHGGRPVQRHQVRPPAVGLVDVIHTRSSSAAH